MPSTTVARRLPVEIMTMVMDGADINQLLLLSHVCADWNAIARAHPLFWRDIRLAALSPTALDFFRARLACSADRPVSITLHLADRPICVELRAVVLAAITLNIHRIAHLGLHLHHETAPFLMDALARPAPTLKTFGIRFFHSSGERPAFISPSLFSGRCPQLRIVTLAEAQLPDPPVMAFSGVHNLTFGFDYPRAFPLNLFAHFPALHHLVFSGESCISGGHGDYQRGHINRPSLRALEMYLTQHTYEPVIHSFPDIAAISRIACKHPQPDIAQQLVDHLTGPLELSFLCVHQGLVHIQLYTPASDRARTLVEYEARILEYLPRAVLFDRGLLERVTLLRIHARLAYLVPHIEEMPNCHTLDIVVDKPGHSLPPLDIGLPLRLPALKTVLVGTDETRARTIVSIPAGTMHSFLMQLLPARATRLALRLHGVFLAGDKGALFTNFAEEVWQY
ncbi:hypothetical protein AURDEDRAFT_175032 [Auricularia subglabra TFB-10046 SS5]|nr:hypothetical protein AURDEDRAFT_175032 [Auricularia subglabra TFB-10046 SS5]